MAKKATLKERLARRYNSSERFVFTEKGNRKQNRVVRSFKRSVRGR